MGGYISTVQYLGMRVKYNDRCVYLLLIEDIDQKDVAWTGVAEQLWLQGGM
jgi:hypothetical protein